jgi:hypothetical protein
MQRFIPCAILLAITCLCVGARAVGQGNQPRLWKDASGKFEIRATLLEQTATNVKLRTDDGREITVPLTRLSPADHEHLKSLNTPTDNPFAGGTPVASRQPATSSAAGGSATKGGTLRALPDSQSIGDELALSATGNKLDLSATPTSSFTPDPSPATTPIPNGVVAISPVDAYDVVSPPVPINGEGSFFVSIGRNMAGKPESVRGRIFAVELKGKASKQVWDNPSCVRVWGHDNATGRTLLVDKLDIFQRGGEFVMVEGLASGAPKQIYRRTLPGAGKPGFAPQVEWATLLSGSHVAAIVDHSLYIWDLAAAKLLYYVEAVNATEPPAFSGNQLYMAIPQNGKIVVVETATGKIVTTLSTGTTLYPGLAFHPDGKLLAVCFSNQYQVWDCTTQSMVNEATTTDHLGSYPVHWIGPKMFRAALGDAVHLDLGMSVWKYNLQLASPPILVGNKLVVSTNVQNCALASAEIPHPSAEKSVRQLLSAGDKAMLVQPGSSVAIAVETSVGGVNQAEIREALATAAKAAGWKVGNSGEVTLVAKIGRGKTQELHYRSMGVGSGPAGRTESTANLTPFTAELEIRRGANVLWTRSSVNHVPFMLHLKEGETVQQAVTRFEKPDPEFFSHLTLPPRIPKPEISQQIGRSILKDADWQDLNVSAPTPRKGRGR